MVMVCYYNAYFAFYVSFNTNGIKHEHEPTVLFHQTLFFIWFMNYIEKAAMQYGYQNTLRWS